MLTAIRKNLKQYWGYEQFRPLQREAMEAVCSGRDSVVVLPTGGGKSLCYQVPAMVLGGTTLVISPLISLMKDQVDTLKENGISAERLDSTIDYASQQAVIDAVARGKVKILYLSPERVLAPGFTDFLGRLDVRFAAIDEAHCVSMWGHDFRPEYRKLSILRQLYGNRITIGAYTATATELVRNDIAVQLGLQNPLILVGSFDRLNLIYRVKRRNNLFSQVTEIIDRHKEESGIVYCIRRNDVENLCAELVHNGYKARPYHAGMPDEERKMSQDAFVTEQADIIVATIAFGMGIDKSNVRYVIHAGMPKTLENYQQESGRAGRDGLEAECHLIWSGEDYSVWKRIIQGNEDAAAEISLKKLNGIYDYCNSGKCRHKELLAYFGQSAEYDSCSACDVCLNELEPVKEPLILAQKIISGVLRLEQRYGAEYNSLVLCGSQDERISAAGHNNLSTYGILKDEPKQSIRNWIEQLVSQGYLCKYGEYNTLGVTAKGWAVLKNGETPRLLKIAQGKGREAKVSKLSWQGVDKGLFEELRVWRSEKAVDMSLPAYVILTDVALREIAKLRPADERDLLRVKGIGAKKLHSYGSAIVEIVRRYCEKRGIPLNGSAASKKSKQAKSTKDTAFEMFSQKASVEDVMQATGRMPSTVWGYLADYITENDITDPVPWVNKSDFERIKQAAEIIGAAQLKPIYNYFEQQIPYEIIRAAVACLA